MVNHDRSPDSTDESPLTRRRLLAVTGAAGLTGLAGCGTEPGDSSPTGSPSGTGETDEPGTGTDQPSVDQTWYTRTSTVPADIRFNMFAQANTDWYTQSLMHGFTAELVQREPLTWVPMLAESWNVDGTTFSIQLNENFTWHDGKSVTAEDYVFQYAICDAMGAGKYYGALEDLTGLPTATGEYTVEMELEERLNPGILLPKHFSEPMWYAPQQYQEHEETIRDASSDSAKQDARTSLIETEFDDNIGFGPLRFVGRNQQELQMEIHEDYPFADLQQQFTDAVGTDVTGWGQPNFNQVIAKHVSSHNQMQQELMAERIDGGVMTYVSPQQLPEGHRIVQYPALHGSGLMWNFWDWGDTPGLEIWRDVNVRKAFAHAVNREAGGIQLGNGVQSTPIDQTMTGMLAGQETQWLDDEFMNSLLPYEHDYGKAEEYLREAGCSKEDGQWYKPDGELFEVVLKTGSNVTHYVNFFEVVSSNLSELGLEVTVRNEPGSTFFSKQDNDSGMQMTTSYWGGGNKHPYFAFDWMYRRNWTSREGEEERDYYLPGDEILEVPPIGEPDASDRVEVDPKALLDELGTTLDESRQQEIIEQLAWATNWSVPKITCNENQLGGAVSNDDWNLPPFESPMLAMNPNYNMIFQFGFVDAKSN